MKPNKSIRKMVIARSKADKIDLYEILKIPKLILEAFGKWPSDHQTLFAKTRGAAFFSSVVVFSVLLFMEAVHVSDDFAAFLTVLTHVSAQISYVTKMASFGNQKAAFITLYCYLTDETLTTIPLGLQEFIQGPFRFAKKIQYGFLMSVGLAVAMMCSVPLITNNNLPISLTAFDLERWYILMYVFQVFIIFNSGACNAALDLTAIAVMSVAKGQVRVLIERIRNFREHAKDREDLTEEGYLAECVVHHNKIIILVERIETVFSATVLMEYLTSILVICNIGFQLVVVEVYSFSFLFMLSFFIAVTFQLGLYCWFGNEIIFCSLAIRDACYESDWFNSNAKALKMLLTIMERSKKPLYLTAGKFSVLSLASFTSVINSAYSFFALMQTMYRKAEGK